MGDGGRGRHLLGVAELGRAGLDELLALSDNFAEVNRRSIPKVPALRGRTVVLAFFEDSTRTRVSFETAAKRLSADTISLSSSGTSVSKGESLRDTARTIAAMGVDALVVRHRSSGVPWQLARWLDDAGRDARTAGPSAPRPWSTPATAGTSIPPRRWSTAGRCAAASARWPACTSPWWATSSTPGSPG